MSCLRHRMTADIHGGKSKPASQPPNSQHVPILPPQIAKKRNNKEKEAADKEDFCSTPEPAAQLVKYQHVAAELPSGADNINYKGKDLRGAIELPQTANNRISGPSITEQAKSPWRRSVGPLVDLTNSSSIFSANRQKIVGAGGLRSRMGKGVTPANFTLLAASNSKDPVQPDTQPPKSQHLPIQLPQSAIKRNNNGKDLANKDGFSSILEPVAQLVKYQHRNYAEKDLEEFHHAALELPQGAMNININKTGKLSADIENFLSTSKHFVKFQESQHKAVQRMVPFADLTYSTALSSNRQKLGMVGDSKSQRGKRVILPDFTLAAASTSEDSVKPASKLPKSHHVPIQPAPNEKKRNDSGKEPANEEDIFSAPGPAGHVLTHRHKNCEGKKLEQFQYDALAPPQCVKSRNKKVKLSAGVDNLLCTSKPSGKLLESVHQAAQLPLCMGDRSYKGKEPSDGEKVSSFGQSSCPPVKRVNCMWSEDAVTEESMPQGENHQLSCFKAKPERKCRRHSAPVTNLPQDFVEKQKAYFAEIDAFELPVEEVSDDSE